MAGGLLLTVAAVLWPQLPLVSASRIELWAAVSLLATLWLLVCIARLAAHRFFTPADIDGGGGDRNTPRAALLQALLQNTLEQVVLAVAAYAAWLWLGPPDRQGLVVVFAGYFALGRLLFLAGYAHGAPARALGFTLTFYPSVALCLLSLPGALARLGL